MAMAAIIENMWRNNGVMKAMKIMSMKAKAIM
jgi:hypothetical protein